MATQEPLLDLEVIKTDNKTYKLVITDADGVAIDITGYLLFFTVKTSLNDEDVNALISKTYTLGATADSVAGICYVILSSTDTNVAIGNYVYDIKLQKNAGATIEWRKTVATGKFKINLTVTKRIS